MLLGGDFNNVLNLNAKAGGLQQISQSSKDFKKWCDFHNLIDIPCKNENCTWNNKWMDFNYIAKKLDIFFIKGDLDANDLNIHSMILSITGSDHFPVRIEFSEPHKPARSSFKCETCGF